MSADAPPLPVSPRLASVLPFVYIAWADGLLEPREIVTIRERTQALEGLDPDECARLQGWLDPDNPPSAETYLGWVRAIQKAAPRIPDAGGLTLTELGTHLGRLAGAPASDAQQQALREIEGALGIVGREAVRDLLWGGDLGGDGMATAQPPVPQVPAPPAWLEPLTRHLDGPEPATRARVRAVLQDPFFAYPDPDLEPDAYRDLVLAWTERLAAEGFGALAYPESVGGQNSILKFIAAFETIAFHDLSLVVKFGVQFGLWGGSVNQLGTERHHQAYLPETASLELPGCFAMSERQHGSNVRDLQTTATLDRTADSWIIHTPTAFDHKEWIGNAARHGRIATVFAQLLIDGEGHGVHAFVVPIRDGEGAPLPGITIADSGHKMGLNGVDNGRIWFDHVRIPRENLLDRFAQVSPEGAYTSPIPSASKRFFVMLGTLVGGRIAVGSGAVSAAKAGLTIAVRYGARRRQFGPSGSPEVPLLDYRTHQRRLLPLVAATYGLNFALHDLAERFAAVEPGGDTREVETDAGALKALASWHCTRTLQEAREACGGEGFRWTSRIAHRKADSDIFTTFEGDNTVLLLQVAKNLLTGYKAEFANMHLFGLVKYLREQADVRLGELNPLARLDAREGHLLDPEWHLGLFERRERQLLVTAATRLKRRIDGGMDSFDAFIDVQDHLLTLALAYAERMTLAAFQRGVETAPDDATRAALEPLCALYALERIEAHRGWYLEQNLFEGNVAKRVRDEVNRLLEQIRPHAVSLVDAFDIPDELLGSDIARGQ